MSRTYRRYDSYGRWGAHDWYTSYGYFSNERYYVEDFPSEEKVYNDLVKYHGDTYSNWNNTSAMKWDHRKKSRAYARDQISKLHKFEDYNDFDYNYQHEKYLTGKMRWGWD